MSYTNGLDKPSDYFNTKLYTGNGSTGHAITGVGFQPDWVWLKNRDATNPHSLHDSVRGSSKYLTSNGADAEATSTNRIESFDSDGFTLGSDGNINFNTENFASWNWLAGGTASSNTDGSITSTVSANTTSGFSIVSYTGNNTNAQTIGHGLGVAPKVYIIKRRDSTSAWGMYHASLGANKYLQLESTNSEATDTGIWNNTAPTSSVLSIGNAGYFNNASGGTYVCYAFAEKKGFSKFGSYTGNGSTDGTFVYTGMRPAFVMIKRSSATQSWILYDNKRSSFNTTNDLLFANTSGAESADNSVGIDFLSNGFKCRSADDSINSGTYIYMAFASNPFVNSNGVPTNAR